MIIGFVSWRGDGAHLSWNETVQRAACCLNTDHKEQSCRECQSRVSGDFNMIKSDEPRRGPPGGRLFFTSSSSWDLFKSSKLTVQHLEIQLLCYFHFLTVASSCYSPGCCFYKPWRNLLQTLTQFKCFWTFGQSLFLGLSCCFLIYFCYSTIVTMFTK